MENYTLTVIHTAADGNITVYPTNRVRLVGGGVEFPTSPDERVIVRLTDGAILVLNSSGTKVFDYDISVDIYSETV